MQGSEIVRLLYIGDENGWHQFVREDNRFGIVWSELQPNDLYMIECMGDSNVKEERYAKTREA
jgi:hypothetical protein